MPRHFAIGELARRSGLSVKTLRFYSDEGLLPPSDRTAAGYRLYDESALARLDRIRTLREVGLDLATIRGVLEETLSLDEALRRRLAAVEAESAALRQVAAALRATLRAPAGEDDLRRLHAVVRLSEDARRAVVDRFFAGVATGTRVDRAWLQSQVDASIPPLPDEPTRAQLDAWIELSSLLSDPAFSDLLRAHAAEVWTEGFDLAASQRAIADVTAAARAALDRGLPPDAPAAEELVESFLVSYARALGRAPDPAFRAWFVAQHRDRDPRLIRYGELIAALRGDAAPAGPPPEWAWLIAASEHAFRARAS